MTFKRLTATAVLAGFVGAFGAGYPAPVEAQNEEPVPKYRIPGTPPEPRRWERRAGTTSSERMFNLLTSIHEDLGEERYAQALARLRAVYDDGRGNEFERALILRNMAFAYAQMDQMLQATRVLEEAITLDSLSHNETQNMFLMQAQLFAMEEHWDAALRTMARYFYWEDKPTTDSLQIMAVAHARKEDYRNTILWTRRLIENSKTPQEDHYSLLLWAHNELKQYPEAINVLREMVPLWPDKLVYWEQLAGLLQQVGKEAESLAVYSVAYQRGLLKEEAKILNLVRYYMVREAPFKAARILKTALDNGAVEATREHWKLLSDAYNLAQEMKDSIAALRKAAALADDGELYMREAQLHAATDDWAQVEIAVAKAIEKGGLDRPGRAWVYRALAAYEQDKLDDALRMFREAAKHEETRRNATQWINYINNEIRVERALRQGI